MKVATKQNPNAARKVRIYPDARLHALWKSWIAGCRFVYNKAIEKLKSGWEGGNYELEALILNSPDLPDWVKAVPRHPKANAVQDAFDANKQARVNNGEARFKSCRWYIQTIKFKNGNYHQGCWYPQLTKGLTFRPSLPLPKDCPYGTQLVYDRKRWFAIIPEYIEPQPSVQDKVIALDPGVRTFLTGYDGASILEIGRADIGRVIRLCLHLDNLLSRATRASKKQRRQMYRAAHRMRSQVRNLIDDLHHKISSFLVRHYKLIFIPTFDVSQMVIKKRRKINKKSVRQMLTWSHYRFKQHLKQMAERNGVLVVETNEAYTSKTCTHCGFVHQKLGSSKLFKCPACGHEHDRDAGGARNIMLRALAGTPFILTDDAVVVYQECPKYTA